MDALRTVKFEDNKLVLTTEQKDMALRMARCRLLDDPAIAQRLRELQAECLSEVVRMVKATNGIP